MFASLIEGVRSFMGAGTPSGEDARDKARMLCRYSVKCSPPGKGQGFAASVVDISRTGMRLEGGAALSKGDRLSISYAEPGEGASAIGPVLVEVVWSRKRAHDSVVLAGVRYQDALTASWVQLVLGELGLTPESPTFQRRKHIRLATALRAELCDADGQRLAEGKVANLSIGGTLIESQTFLAAGSAVGVKISPYNNFPVFSVPAQVLQCRGEGPKTHLLSLQFQQVNAQETKTLKKFVLNLLKGRSIS